MRRARLLVLVWLILLVLSHLTARFVQVNPPLTPRGAVRAEVDLPAMNEGGPTGGAPVTTSYVEWPPERAEGGMAPVVLLHGCPGQGSDFRALAPLLAGDGRRVIAPDLHGLGASEPPPDYSIAADAWTALALLDEMGVERAHVVGWSQGGGAAIWMAELAPERIASITLMASIGAQEAEGSGSYRFEHAKYAVGYVGLVVLPELIPHFGLLGSHEFRKASIRAFWDTDQRPLKNMLKALEAPTLVLHGRSDFLVPAWGAELHHRITPGSRLVMLDANHFLPFLQPEETAAHLRPFLARHDAPGVRPLPGRADFAPSERAEVVGIGPFEINDSTRWWLIVLIVIAATFISEDATVIAVGLAVAHQHIDIGVGLLACFVGIALGDGGLYLIGRIFGRRALRWPVFRAWISEDSLERWGRWFDRHTIKAVFLARAIPGTRLPTYLAAGVLSRRTHGFLLWAAIAAFLWTPVVLLLAILLGPAVLGALLEVFSGPVAVVVSIVLILLVFRVLTYAFTWQGRRRLLRDAKLPFLPEFWPAWLFYAPLVPWIAWLCARHGPMTFTCVNPGIPHGGGIVGESRRQILEGLGPSSEFVLHSRFIDAGPQPAERAEEAAALIENDPALGGYPVILKPDAGQRGHGVRLARTPEDVARWFEEMTRPAIVQRYHPGPEEAGVLWSREPGPGFLEGAGRIVGITRKVFPVIEGDGESTLETLIWRHPRFMMQADMFLKRHDAKRDMVLARGETMRLAMAGNHCQGTMFLDGSDLITPALLERISGIARAFDHAGFDFGRFDIRYTTDEDLRAGRGLAIVELNGAMSESTHLYDPRRSIFWAYGVLFAHWSLLYRVGAERRRAGARPMPLGEVLRAVRDHYRGRPGSVISD